MTRDPYGRPMTNIRISLMRRCNLRCFFCHNEGESHGACREMTVDEIAIMTRIAADLGMRKVKLTGGEPLLRRDIRRVIRKLSSIDEIEEVSMTTNGTKLSKMAEELIKAGLRRVNVNLPTLNRTRYEAITGKDLLSEVIDGIKAATEVGLSPVKLNMVLLSGVNDDEVDDMIDFASQTKAILQIIELVPPPNVSSKIYGTYHRNLNDIEGYLDKHAVEVVTRRMHRRKKYLLPNDGEVEIVRPMHNTEFCMNCMRLRLTSDGKLKPCLMREDNLVDFLTPFRAGAGEEELKTLLLEAIRRREPYWLTRS